VIESLSTVGIILDEVMNCCLHRLRKGIIPSKASFVYSRVKEGLGTNTQD
jgi:hypothetical protein